ncbi:MAG TPA: hypothetical protein VFD46_05550 [Chryseolinea sp.]|nr:hypothetical protein [Chryseolinea sp.]
MALFDVVEASRASITEMGTVYRQKNKKNGLIFSRILEARFNDMHINR